MPKAVVCLKRGGVEVQAYLPGQGKGDVALHSLSFTAGLIFRLYNLGYFYFPLIVYCKGESNTIFKFLLPILYQL